MQHEVDHGDSDPRFGRFVKAFVVLREAAALVEPGERALDDPEFADDLKSVRFVASLHDVEEPVAERGDLRHKLARISAIGVHAAQSRPVVAPVREEHETAIAVLHGSGKHRHRKHESECVDEQMSLGAFDFLPRVVAA